MGSERPENCPVDSFQWRTGGSPGKGVATIEVAERKANDSPVGCPSKTEMSRPSQPKRASNPLQG